MTPRRAQPSRGRPGAVLGRSWGRLGAVLWPLGNILEGPGRSWGDSWCRFGGPGEWSRSPFGALRRLLVAQRRDLKKMQAVLEYQWLVASGEGPGALLGRGLEFRGRDGGRGVGRTGAGRPRPTSLFVVQWIPTQAKVSFALQEGDSDGKNLRIHAWDVMNARLSPILKRPILSFWGCSLHQTNMVSGVQVRSNTIHAWGHVIGSR